MMKTKETECVLNIPVRMNFQPTYNKLPFRSFYLLYTRLFIYFHIDIDRFFQ